MERDVAVVLLSILILPLRLQREKPESGFASSEGEEEKEAIFCKSCVSFSGSIKNGSGSVWSWPLGLLGLVVN